MAVVNRRWLRELATFFCFLLPFAALPIGFFYAMRSVLGYPHTWQLLLADGSIFTISIGLNADAMSRLYASESKWVALKLLLGGFAALAMACGSFFYGLRIVTGRSTRSYCSAWASSCFSSASLSR